MIVGYRTGTVVRRVGSRGMGSAAAIATVCGIALGLLFIGLPLGLLWRFCFPVAIAAHVASYRANH